MFSVLKQRNSSKTIAFMLLLIVGSMLMVGQSMASSEGTDVHLELNIKEGLESQAIWVGLFTRQAPMYQAIPDRS